MNGHKSDLKHEFIRVGYMRTVTLRMVPPMICPSPGLSVTTADGPPLTIHGTVNGQLRTIHRIPQMVPLK